MDFGDLLVLIFIALGGLSSILGAKKKPKRKKSSQRQEAGRPSVGRPAARRAGVQTTVGREVQHAREEAKAEMDRILRQLGLSVGLPEPAPPAPEPPPEPADIIQTYDDIPAYDDLAAVPAVPAGEASHQRFHDLYIEPMGMPSVGPVGGARASRYVNPRSLREVMLVREILGTPKGLQ